MVKKILFAIIPVVLILAIGIGAIVIYTNYEPYNLDSIQKAPFDQLERSFEKTGEALEAGLVVQIPDSVKNAFETGSITLEMNADSEEKQSVIYYPRKDSHTIIIPDTENKKQYGLWLGEDAVAMLLPGMPEDKAYGFNPQTLRSDLKDSYLLELLGVSYDDVIAFLDAIEEERSQAGESEWKTLLELKAKLEELIKTAAVAVDEGNLTIGFDTVKVYRVCLTLDSKQLCNAMDILAQSYLKSESFKLMEQEDPEAKKQFDDAIAESKKMLQESNATVTTEFYLHGESQVIVKMESRIHCLIEEKMSEVATFTVELGADPKTSTQYTITASTTTPQEGKTESKLIYSRSHAHNLPGRTLMLITPDEKTTILDFQYNEVSGFFEVELMNHEIAFSGSCVTNGDTVKLMFTSDDMSQNAIIFTGVAEAPKVPEYINVCKLPEDKLAELLEKFAGEAPVIPEEGEFW